MSDLEYLTWKEHHAALFNLRTPEDAAMFDAWFPMLCDYLFLELKEASNKIVKLVPLPFRAQQLGALRRAITEAKLAAQEADDKANEIEGKTCPLCDNTGWARVPHVKYVIDGVWQAPYPETTVLCSCAKGSSLLNKQRLYRDSHADLIAQGKRSDPMSMSLKENVQIGRRTMKSYEQCNPFWEFQVAERKKLVPHEETARAMEWRESLKKIGKMP
jgi:hypothetical protein